jgi:hypothetical protein
MATPYPVLAEEQYKAPAPWRSAAIAPDWIAHSLATLGWELQDAVLGELDLTFVDGAGVTLPSPPIEIESIPTVKSLPHLAYARIPADQLTFSRQSLWLFVEVTQIAESWARQWADYVLQMGKPEKIPLGVGFAVEPGAVIDAGELMLRATWGSETEPGAGMLTIGSARPATELLSLTPTAGA